MSTYFVEEVVDSSVDIEATTKSTNLKWIKIRFIKYGDPLGNMKLQVLNSAKDTILAESNTLLTNFTSESNYVGSNDTTIMSWIRFDFLGEALKLGTTYFFRVFFDSTYYTNRTDTSTLFVIKDYPKPTNDADTATFENTHGRNFQRYPPVTIQAFGRDFG